MVILFGENKIMLLKKPEKKVKKQHQDFLLNEQIKSYERDILLAEKIIQLLQVENELIKEIINKIKDIYKSFDLLIKFLKKFFQEINLFLIIILVIIFFKNEIINVFVQLFKIVILYFSEGLKMFNKLTVEERFRYMYIIPITSIISFIIGRKLKR